MDFRKGNGNTSKNIPKGNAGMSKGAWIDDDEINPILFSLLNAVD